ncbi:MAG: EutN/CcmL family microcompartment protein [Ignavibacteriaceae bacterium]|nr:EutN/CcmL family microcompartment protein [Ignavibacteriaceae bacterium]
MLLAKVKGNVVSTQKNSELKGHKLLIVNEIDLHGNFKNKQDVIAIDLIDSGIGDTVLVTQEGDAVQQILGHKKAPVHSIIVANVDKLDIPNNK